MSLRRPFLELDGAVVVITGASSGIGRLTARRLARRGARVLAARDRAALEAIAESCRTDGGEALVVVTDVSDPDAVTASPAGSRSASVASTPGSTTPA